MSAARELEAEEWSRLGLAEFLRFAVPLRAAELLPLRSYAERRRRLPYGVTAYLGAGDAVMFRGKVPRNSVLAADAEAWALALLALETRGGASFLGVHWCTGEHEGCPHARMPEPDPDPRAWWEPLAELAALGNAAEGGGAS